MDTVSTKINTAKSGDKFIIRKARRDDLDDVLAMIQELADFEKLSDGPKLTVEDLIRDGGFNSDTAHPLFVCFVAEEVLAPGSSELCRRPRLFGYVMTFVGYSTWTGKVLQIKDFFVSAPARSLGVGQAMFRAVGEHAVRGGYERLDYYVFNWNKRAIRFYEQLGAVDVTVADQWNMYRIPLLK